MKSILIPTTLEADTLNAVRAGIKHATGNNTAITLLLISELNNNYSAGFTLHAMNRVITPAQEHILEDCRKEALRAKNVTVHVHNQYGLSAPVLRNLLEYLATDLVIIPQSYRLEKKHINKYCVKLLTNCRKPILQLSSSDIEKEAVNALYLEQEPANLNLSELQQVISSQFNFKIISHAKITDGQTPHELTPEITKAVTSNNIGLVVETRSRTGRAAKKSGLDINDTLGLPVLSIYQEVADKN